MKKKDLKKSGDFEESIVESALLYWGEYCRVTKTCDFGVESWRFMFLVNEQEESVQKSQEAKSPGAFKDEPWSFGSSTERSRVGIRNDLQE